MTPRPSLASVGNAKSSFSVLIAGASLVVALLTLTNIDVSTAQLTSAVGCTNITFNITCCASSDVCEWVVCKNESKPDGYCTNITSGPLPDSNCTKECVNNATTTPAPTTTHTTDTATTTTQTAATTTTNTTHTEATTTTETAGTTTPTLTSTVTHPTGTSTQNTATTLAPYTGTTLSTGTAQTTTAHNITTTAKPPSCGGFDGASFVGGIVLGVGVIGIAFFIYKFVVSKRDGDAHYQQF